jgi:hypothetical protein
LGLTATWIEGASAAVQAVAAISIAVLTFFLVRARTQYANRSDEMAKHMAHSNRLAEENVARVARRNAARLGARPGDRGHTDGAWVFQYVVSNWGEGVAQDGSLTFDMDQPTLPAALRPGEESRLNLLDPYSEIPRDVDPPGPEHPRVRVAYFRDAVGDWWQQHANPKGNLGPASPLIEG